MTKVPLSMFLLLDSEKVMRVPQIEGGGREEKTQQMPADL